MLIKDDFIIIISFVKNEERGQFLCEFAHPARAIRSLRLRCLKLTVNPAFWIFTFLF